MLEFNTEYIVCNRTDKTIFAECKTLASAREIFDQFTKETKKRFEILTRTEYQTSF